MKKEKLLALAKLLRDKAAEWKAYPEGVAGHFNMGFWVGTVPHHCGFAGCAIGTLIRFAPETTGLRFSSGEPYLPDYEEWGFSAIAIEFEIPIYSAKYLFLDSNYDYTGKHDPEIVAARIEDFVENEWRIYTK